MVTTEGYDAPLKNHAENPGENRSYKCLVLRQSSVFCHCLALQTLSVTRCQTEPKKALCVQMTPTEEGWRTGTPMLETRRQNGMAGMTPTNFDLQ